MDSKYYSIQEEILSDDNITREQMGVKLREALEEELAHPEIYSDWIVSHYNSSAEYLSDYVICEPEASEEEIFFYYEEARKESELFRKYGYEHYADWIMEIADNAVETWKKAG